MGRLKVQYIGDLDLAVPEAAVEVRNDGSYVHACHTIAMAVKVGEGPELWVRTRHHFAWLKDYLTQMRVVSEFSEKTARTMLAEEWAVTIPDWVSEEDILEHGLLALETKVGTSKTFEATLVSTVIGVDVGADLPDDREVAHLITTLSEEAYASVKKRFPILDEAIRRLAAQWHIRAGAGWLGDLCDLIPNDIETVWRLVSASSILRSYPKELLDRVLPTGQAVLARKIPNSFGEHVPLEHGAREEALTQVKLLFAEITPKVESQHEFRKVVSWVSGKTVEELRLIENILKSDRFEPTEEDIRLVQEAFGGCAEVRQSRLDVLKHVVRPPFPALLRDEEVWNAKDWRRWTVDQYAPYRDWQIRSGRYDAELEKTVCSFSNWYVANYSNVQADTDIALIHALSTLAQDVQEERLTVVLMVDCLPVTFFNVVDHALRTSGFRRHDLSYRYAALPSVTAYNKAAILTGKPGRTESSYSDLLADRSTRDWGDVAAHYIATIRELSEVDPGVGSMVVFVNHVEGDDILHSDVESKNRTYEEELARSYSQLSEALFEMCDRWTGPREHVSVVVLTDHGACRVLEEERKSFDSSLVSKLFDDERHRVATITRSQAEKVPENLWDIGYRFTTPFSDDDLVHFLPRGHNTVRKAGSGGGYMHGGVAPEEVIVPVARYGLVAVAWKKPFTRFVNLEMSSDGKRARFYIQRVVKIEIEVQNPNSVVLHPTALELLLPHAAVRSVELHDVDPESICVLSIDLYFQKAAQTESGLELKLRYTIGGEEYEQVLVLPAEFRSAMSGGFSLKDL